MKYLNELAEAKRVTNVEGAILYITDKGKTRKQLSGKEKQLYKIEFKKGTQYVLDEKNKQIQPAKTGKSSKKNTPKLQDASDASMDRSI